MHGFRLLAATLFPLLLPASASAGPETVYEGTVGTARVVMAITEDKGEVYGHYFYRTSRLDIDLSGKAAGTTLSLESRTTGDHLDLERRGANLGGVLTTAKARRLTVSLRPAGDPAELPADLPPKLSRYEHWRLAGLRLTAEQPETIRGRTIRWYKEPLSGIRLFRVESGYSAPAMAAVNHALARNQWQDVSAWFACTGSDGQPGTDVAQAERPWLGANHMSYVWTASWSCAGTAHPDFGSDGHSYDMRTGRELTLDAVLHFGPAPIPAQDSDAWYNYRGDRFAPGVVALLKRYHPEEMAPPANSGEDCDYSDPEVWDFPAWALSDKGLWLGAYFPRVQRPCDGPDWAIIPWSALDRPRGEQP
jgi:hypothetical protein